MRKVCLGLLLCCFLILPVSGEMAAPPVPEAGERLMPAQNQSFSQGLRQIAGELLPLLRPELARGLASGAGLVALCLLLALFLYQITHKIHKGPDQEANEDDGTGEGKLQVPFVKD